MLQGPKKVSPLMLRVQFTNPISIMIVVRTVIFIVLYGQIYVVKNIVQLLWKVFNYVLNCALLGNVRVYCCLFRSFYLLKLLPGLKLLLSTNKFL